jgi:uncharacterized protein
VTQTRFPTLDAVRGFAVMGILLMNIVSMGMPGYAYVDPLVYGNAGPADTAVWLVNYVVADGKMRALFTMLFGASTVLIAERAAAGTGPGPGETHYRRMFWLFVFGMIHAWLFWYGDILTQYAIAGSLAFALWRWQPRALWIAFALFLAAQVAVNLGHYADLAQVRDPALAVDATPQAVAAWQARLATEIPDARALAAEVAGYRGDFATVFAARAPSTIFFQTFLVPVTLAETLAFFTLGMLFFRNGFFTGQWSRRRYAMVIAIGYLVAAPLTWLIARALLAARFDPALIALADTASLMLRPFIALAHAAAVILLVRAEALRSLAVRLEAAGRMAFSNYLGTSLVTTTLFYGYGFALFGSLSRAELYIVVLAVWIAILGWSKPWLARFRYGPLEWLWRSLARSELQPFKK